MRAITFLVSNKSTPGGDYIYPIMSQTQNKIVSISVEKTHSGTSRFFFFVFFFKMGENLIFDYDDSHQDVTESSCGVYRRTYSIIVLGGPDKPL